MNLRDFFSIKLNIKYYYHKDTNRFIIGIVFFNKLIIRKIIYPNKMKKKKAPKNDYIKSYVKDRYKEILRIFDVEYILVKSKLGVEDAALTAVVSGMLYGAYGSLLAVLGNYAQLKNVSINVYPVYNKFYFDLSVQCILKIKKANAIKEIFRFIFWFIKKKVKVFKDERASNMRSYDHGYAKY